MWILLGFYSCQKAILCIFIIGTLDVLFLVLIVSYDANSQINIVESIDAIIFYVFLHLPRIFIGYIFRYLLLQILLDQKYPNCKIFSHILRINIFLDIA